jgi:hypothetical protein
LKDPILFPKKAGFFNAQFKNNDGLLANHIAKKNILRICRKRHPIRSAELEKKLEENGIINLKNIGELHLNADNNLVFKPADQTNYLTTAFGLTSLFLH